MARPRAQVALENGLDGHTAEASREFGSAQTAGAAVDIFTITDRERSDWGIGADEEVRFVARNRPGAGRVQQMRGKYGDARPVRTADGRDPYEHMDVQAVAVPRAGYEAVQEELRRQAEEYESMFRPTPNPEVYQATIRDDMDKDAMVARRNEVASMFDKLGIGEGSETVGMDLDEGVAHLRRRGILPEDLMREVRRNGREEALSQSDFAAIIGNTKPQKERGKTFGVGAGLGNQNPNSAVAQARRREGRA